MKRRELFKGLGATILLFNTVKPYWGKTKLIKSNYTDVINIENYNNNPNFEISGQIDVKIGEIWNNHSQKGRVILTGSDMHDSDLCLPPEPVNCRCVSVIMPNDKKMGEYVYLSPFISEPIGIALDDCKAGNEGRILVCGDIGKPVINSKIAKQQLKATIQKLTHG